MLVDETVERTTRQASGRDERDVDDDDDDRRTSRPVIPVERRPK
jgi:hypothetical protein